MPETTGDPTRLVILWPRSSAPEGLVTLRVDLSVFFHTARRIGPDTALLLLTLRALGQRTGFGVKLKDLQRTLGVSRRWVVRRIQRLSDAGLLVYHSREGDSITVELTAVSPDPGVFTAEGTAPHLAHDLPTHWFVQILPRGRKEFLAYLYLRSREREEGDTGLLVSSLVRNAGLYGPLHAKFMLYRLRRLGLIRNRRAGLVVLDPPPLTRSARLYLRLRETGAIPRTTLGRAAYLAFLVGLLVLLLTIVTVLLLLLTLLSR